MASVIANFVVVVLFVATFESADGQPNIIATVGNPETYCGAASGGGCDACLTANNATVIGQGFLCVWCLSPLSGGNSTCLSANITRTTAIAVLEKCPNLNFYLATCALTVQNVVVIIAVACLLALLCCVTCVGVCICCCVKACIK